MDFEVGKLYKCSSHCLLIYPTKEKAASQRTPHDSVTGAAIAVHWSDYWSKYFDCKVRYSIPNEPFMVLKIDNNKNKYNDLIINILCGDKIGWIICREKRNLVKIEELV